MGLSFPYVIIKMYWPKTAKAAAAITARAVLEKTSSSKVPLGTIARDELTSQKEAEILEDGQEVIWLKGGRGGLGNASFATPTNQAPEHAQPGEPGVEAWKVLELKVLADVGLVGFPNAGKSTLLSVLTAATPKIANYAFTTLVPQLGMVEYRDGRSFCIADLPAYPGRGGRQGPGTVPPPYRTPTSFSS